MFINPERNSFPDIDQDFQDDRREEVIKYMYEKYGQDKVCRIMTIGTLAAKGAIREVCRRFEVPYSEANELAKLIPGPVRGRNVDLEEAIKIEPRFAEAIKSNPLYRKIYDIALVMEGMAKNTGIHAAGLILSNELPLIEHIALMAGKNGEITSADVMGVLEDLGFIKFDFLGLKTLTIVQIARQWIKKNHGIDIDPYEIPVNDDRVYSMIREGKIFGVFQLGGSSGFRDITMRMAPETIAHLSDINAMYRPGPLDNGFPEDYCTNKEAAKNGKAIKYMMSVDNREMQKEIEKILKPTFGVCLYQEQIQFIAQKVAGYTLGGADNLRRAIGKKKPKEMEEQKAIFIDGCIKNKISKQSAEELFTQIEKFADYCFNKSHSVSYSIISYWTAWLKYYYPHEFMAANLTAVKGDQDKTIEFINACREEGIKILPPDINASDLDYTPLKDGIRFGLGAVKGLGESAINPILEERRSGKYTSYFNFLTRLKDHFSKIKRSDISTLIKCGAFDTIEKVA
ncbi:MAG: DNA polymerase III subunit alpha [Lachnospiraceae bacterium]|nr:DNA polymerase III subunit alpha [Lachnospiraceae bacterium]